MTFGTSSLVGLSRGSCKFFRTSWTSMSGTEELIDNLCFSKSVYPVRRYCLQPVYGSSKALQERFILLTGFSSRSFASKNVKKDSKGKSKSVEVSPDQLQEVVDFAEYEASLQNLVEEFRELLSKQFALRTSSASFDSIIVEMDDGKKHPLNTLVQITFKTPQLVMLNLSAHPTYIPVVVKALEKSGLNLSPQVEGHMVYIAVPKVSRDHRETLAKNAKAANNKFRERLRAVQNTYVRKAKNQTEKSEDLIHNVVKKIMESADVYSKQLDAVLQSKQAELLATQ